LTSGYNRSRSVFDDAANRRRIAELEERTRSTTFWDDPQAAQHVMRDLAELRERADALDAAARSLTEAREMLALFDGDASAEEEAERSIESARHSIEALEMAASFSGRFDGHNAIVSLFAGAGGVDADDWG
jgi:peptide chain release factor 2